MPDISINDLLLLTFFKRFSQFEYGMKREGYMKPGDRKIRLDWDKLENELGDELEKVEQGEVGAALRYLERKPPKRQVQIDGRLGWDDIVHAPDECHAARVLSKMRAVRNNLFHGGKYGKHDVPLVERDKELLRSCLAVLNECAALVPEIGRHLEGSDDPPGSGQRTPQVGGSIDLSDLIGQFEEVRSGIDTIVAPPGPGVYVIYLKSSGHLRPFTPGPNRVIYAGSSGNLAEREHATHFETGKTGFSSLRRSIGAIRKQEMDLVAIPRSSGRSETNHRNYKFHGQGEEALTEWMKDHLEIALIATAHAHEEVERDLIRRLEPLLNLKGWKNPNAKAVKDLRKICRTEAKTNRGRQ